MYFHFNLDLDLNSNIIKTFFNKEDFLKPEITTIEKLAKYIFILIIRNKRNYETIITIEQYGKWIEIMINLLQDIFSDGDSKILQLEYLIFSLIIISSDKKSQKLNAMKYISEISNIDINKFLQKLMNCIYKWTTFLFKIENEDYKTANTVLTKIEIPPISSFSEIYPSMMNSISKYPECFSWLLMAFK